MTDHDGNLDHLKRTIAALREQLEQAQFEQTRKVQEAVATLQVENAELKKTVASMRSEMDRILIKQSEKIQDLSRDNRDELKHLQETIASLRVQLEEKVGR